MSRPGNCQRCPFFSTFGLTGRHFLDPVLPVSVTDPQSYGRSQGSPVPYTTNYHRLIGLDLHAATATVPQLPPCQVAIDIIDGHAEASRYAFNYGNQLGAMGFACCRKAKRQEITLP